MLDFSQEKSFIPLPLQNPSNMNHLPSYYYHYHYFILGGGGVQLNLTEIESALPTDDDLSRETDYWPCCVYKGQCYA